MNKKLAFLEELWSVWASLGLYVNSSSVISASPETALIGLAVFGRYDQRLFDEALSLISSHPTLFRPCYIKYWRSFLSAGAEKCLCLILKIAGISDRGSQENSILPDTMCSPLFLDDNGEPIFQGEQFDPFFQECGFTRNKFIPSKISPQLDVIARANTWVRLRLTIGLNANADIMLILLHKSTLSAPILSALLGISTKSAWLILQDFMAAGWVTKKTIGRKDRYTVTEEFQRAFSYFKHKKMKWSPLDWILAGYTLEDIIPPGASVNYKKFSAQQRDKKMAHVLKLKDQMQVDGQSL